MVFPAEGHYYGCKVYSGLLVPFTATHGKLAAVWKNQARYAVPKKKSIQS
jgi:hypothetical protein